VVGAEPGHHAAVRPGNRRTIVVVERTPAVQELVDQALRETGHRVFVTKDPLEALELAYRVRVDLVVCDERRLEDTGVLGDLRSIQPWLAFLYLEDGEGMRHGTASTLEAPFSLDELQEAVEAALDDRRD
jgi:DNA-binding NtrC family response regulator